VSPAAGGAAPTSSSTGAAPLRAPGRLPTSATTSLRTRRVAPLSVLGRTISNAWNDRVLGLSAEAAFWQLLSLASLYHVVLPRRLPWRRHIPGAVFAMVVFVLGAWALRIYVSYFFATTVPYAALAVPIAALLFCFLLGLSVLLGAELNAAIQARWPAPPRKIDRHRSARQAMEAERAGSTLLSF